MRISTHNQFYKVQNNIYRVQGDMSDYQTQITTGKKFSRASENPNAAKQAEVVQHALNSVEQYKQNVNDVKGMMTTMETSLRSAYDSMTFVNSEITKASNESYSAADMKAFETVIEGSIEQLTSLGNTKHMGRYVFSGEKILTKPFDYDGTNITYNGNNKEMEVEISPYTKTKAVENGDKIFSDAITDLIQIRDLLQAKDTDGLRAKLSDHQKNMDTIMNKTTEIGARMNGMDMVEEGFNEQELNLQQRLSAVEDADFTEVMVDYSIAQRTYQATLKSSSMMFETSIMKYI